MLWQVFGLCTAERLVPRSGKATRSPEPRKPSHPFYFMLIMTKSKKWRNTRRAEEDDQASISPKAIRLLREVTTLLSEEEGKETPGVEESTREAENGSFERERHLNFAVFLPRTKLYFGRL